MCGYVGVWASGKRMMIGKTVVRVREHRRGDREIKNLQLCFADMSVESVAVIKRLADPNYLCTSSVWQTEPRQTLPPHFPSPLPNTPITQALS